jgi:anti-sigma-K factor RskA
MSDEMTHESIDELAGAFALGAVTAEEAAAVRAHLATCDQPHAALREAFPAGDVLAASLEPVQPSSALRDRLMSTVERMPRADRGRVAEVKPPWPRTGWFDWISPRVARPLAVAAVVAAIALGAWNIGLRSDLDQREAALRAVAAAIANGQTAFRVDGSAGRGYVVDTPGEGASLVVADLKSLPADRLYELWLLDAAGTPVAVGTFTDTSGAVAVLPVEKDLSGYATFAVTVETERVDAPTSTPVMVGDLTGGPSS